MKATLPQLHGRKRREMVLSRTAKALQSSGFPLGIMFLRSRLSLSIQVERCCSSNGLRLVSTAAFYLVAAQQKDTLLQ